MRWALLVVALCGCIADPTVACGELTCPRGDVCTPGGCATPAEADACAMATDASPCTTTTIAIGVCRGGACRAVVCGDGRIDPPEACDDGNTTAGDGCSADCDSTEVCGNGVVDLVRGEECDDGGIVGLSADGCSSGCKHELERWSDISPQPVAARTGAMLAYDNARQELVLFGGYTTTEVLGDTWTWDGAWHLHKPVRSPPARGQAAFAYDPIGQRIVMFGGITPVGDLDDTWLWDGTTWTQAFPPTSPSPRDLINMAFDQQHKVLVLYGGRPPSSGMPYGDTWAWDGTTWTQLSPANSPPPLYGYVIAHETASKLLLYGGYDGANGRTDTWEWDEVGQTWTTLASAHHPTQQVFAGATFDTLRSRIVVTGGYDSISKQPIAETWEWNGTDWVQGSGVNEPPAAQHPAFAYDLKWQVSIRFGGFDLGPPQQVFGDTFAWSGTMWMESPAQLELGPGQRDAHAMAYDSRTGETVLFGGRNYLDALLGDTWVLDQAGWALVPSAIGPSARDAHAMAYDAGHDAIVLFGGQSITGPLSDTWLYTTHWVAQSSLTGPSARRATAMAFDAARGNIVLFGGLGATNMSFLGDTWIWDGAGWSQATPATSPSPRYFHQLVYDGALQRVILFGGRDNGDLGDTWAWDGVTWTQLAPATSPPARGGYAMTYDAAARRIVLFGGGFGPVSYNDTWMFDGTTWTERTPETPPPVRFEAAMIYDPIRHASVIFGGVGLAQALSDTQALTSLGVGITPSIEACVVATDDVDGDGLSGCADPDCWGRCTPLCPPGETCAPDLPRCGDAMCTPPLEDYLICPADCPAP